MMKCVWSHSRPAVGWSWNGICRLVCLLTALLSMAAAQAKSPQAPLTAPLNMQMFDGRVLSATPDSARVQTRYGVLKAQINTDQAPHAGDLVQLYGTTDAAGRVSYAISDFERRPVLVALLLIFVLVAFLVGRGKGLRAVLGMLCSLAVIVLLVVPAILHGYSPVPVALLGVAGILLLTVYFVHGLSWTTSAALLGTFAASLCTVGLAALTAYLAHLSGIVNEETLFMSQMGLHIDLRALLLAGVTISALGAVVDATIPQAAVVRELAHLGPQLSWRQLFTAAMRVGTDHIGSLINTLVLAYAGTSLPLFLSLYIGGLGLGEALNAEYLASAVVQTLIGSIGLVLAVPLTTLLAALTFRGDRLPAPAPGEIHHHHH